MRVQRKTRIESVIPVSSMSDIAFLLLIFLMLSSIMNLKKNIEVKTPEAKQVSTTEGVQKYEIIIDKNGNAFFDGNYILLQEITAVFSQNIDREPDLYVQINADEAATYEMVNQVIKALQDARCYRLLFICKRLKEEQKP